MLEDKRDEEKTIKLKAGEKVSICTCGKSRNLPFCDNEHRKLNKENNKKIPHKSLKIRSKQDTEIMVYSSNWINNKKIENK